MAAFGGFEGRALGFGGIVTLTADAARAVSDLKIPDLTFANVGAFRGMTRLTPEAARGLPLRTSREPQIVFLDWVLAFDDPDAVETARLLAEANGPLLLPRLRRISPTALTVLISKNDLRIPPLDTLELIAEPDGGSAEEFVIPEGFLGRRELRRQRRQAAERAAGKPTP